MGYTTEFQGTLKFKKELTASQLAHLSSFLGEDIRDHSDWINPTKGAYYIQFELTKDFSGIAWDGSEKFYDAEGCVNLLIANMQLIDPDFGFVGELQAQGEDYDDRWILRMVDNKAVRIEHPKLGGRVTCPHCECEIVLEESTGE